MTLFLASILMILPYPSLAGDPELSEDYSMKLDPSAKQKVGEAEYQSLMNFFHDAERAIESKDLEELMTLYSARYTNLDQDKKFAEGVWKRIFANFDDLAATHSIELLTYDEASGEPVAVLECTGLLLGTPKAGGRRVVVDSWDSQWHVLIKEERWRLFGNAGRAKVRFGSDDKKSHPLF